MNRTKRKFLWPIWSLLALLWMAALPLASCASACSCPCDGHLSALAATHDDDDCDDCESAAPASNHHAVHAEVASRVQSHLCQCQPHSTPAFVAVVSAPTSHFEAFAPVPIAVMPVVSRPSVVCVFRPRGHSPPRSFVPLLRASRAPPTL